MTVAERFVGTEGEVVSRTAVTVTVADWVALPPVPVQARVYVVATVGETGCVPETAFVPVHPPLAVHEVALVEDQVRVEELPCVIEAGLADSVMVGIGAILVKKSSADQPSGVLS